MSEKVARQLYLSWGVTPAIMPFANSTDEMIDLSVQSSLSAGLIQNGDLVVITAGVPVGVSGTTNMIKAHLVGNSLVNGIGIGTHNAIGRVDVCHHSSDANSKFKSGDVLVCASTNNDMLVAMKEASAIVTEEAGMNSHAAVVGLALDIPVVVGAAGATIKLQDGQMVAVDAKRGIVQSVPE
jgi:pyruvate kinase